MYIVLCELSNKTVDVLVLVAIVSWSTIVNMQMRCYSKHAVPLAAHSRPNPLRYSKEGGRT